MGAKRWKDYVLKKPVKTRAVEYAKINVSQ